MALNIKQVNIWAGAHGVGRGNALVTFAAKGKEYLIHFSVVTNEVGTFVNTGDFVAVESSRRKASWRVPVADLEAFKATVLAKWVEVAPGLDFATATREKLALEARAAADTVVRLAAAWEAARVQAELAAGRLAAFDSQPAVTNLATGS